MHPEQLDHARALRRGMTRFERHLWYDFLRTYPVKWYNQRPVIGYILDFYCHRSKLAVELDGGQHYEEAEQRYDALRTTALERQGISVLRFSNLEVEQNFLGVCETIDRQIKEKKKAVEA